MTNSTYGTTADGRVIDDAMVQRLAAQAEAGFPGVRFVKPRTGRPWLSGSGPSGTRTVRLPEGLDAALAARAKAENTTPSHVIREALRDYLAPA
ncbi:MAG: ribbon-helix-helix protein, CopG family [Bifidobacteriaceae bacterium]|jgi:hypothetical protein|nr:ribbon-helix-helix protein, CopG family [Bifidobacteriaceae bacterium]